MEQQPTTLSQDFIDQVINERNQYRADLEQAATSITRLMQTIGLMDEDGQYKKANPAAMVGLVTKLMTGNKKALEQFQFMAELAPLLTKYADLTPKAA